MRLVKFAVLSAAISLSLVSQGIADGDDMRARAPTAPKSETLLSAGPEDLAAATGHYARTRSLLLAAIREFDAGYKLANPDALMDSQLFRETLLTRAKELETVLDPQPRASKSGVRFNPDSRLLGGK
jgi:hypothetical protein